MSRLLIKAHNGSTAVFSTARHSGAAHNSDFSFSAKLYAFSVQYTLTLAFCQKITFEAFTTEASQLDLGGWAGGGGVPPLALQKSAKSEF